MDDQTIPGIRAIHPFPWAEVVHPTGQVVVLDKNLQEVPLFTVLKLVKIMTSTIEAHTTKQG